MPRPRRCRKVFFEPYVTHFRPVGVVTKAINESILTREELEAVRLIDYEEMEQGEASKKMDISQPTLSRLLDRARKKLASALINGNSIRIQGGNFTMVQPRRGLQNGRGRMGGPVAGGLGGMCKCPKCGYTEPHERATPCSKKLCPKCGTRMVRE